MFEFDEMSRVVELQEKSYGLLKWVSSALETNKVSFNHVHEAMSAADAANEWIRRHWSNIPTDSRPGAGEVEAFARLFSSYLTTSFELHKNPPEVPTSPCGCFCPWCTYMAAGPRLKTRKITKNARKDAVELKAIYLEQLASSVGRSATRHQLLTLADDPDCSYNASLSTYAFELLRRTKFASQGYGVLVLWREIAWIDNHPRNKFRLDPNEIIAAEQQLAERVESGTL